MPEQLRYLCLAVVALEMVAVEVVELGVEAHHLFCFSLLL
jgi:hypothetical protein